jgi:hypothetical protein
MSVFDWGPFMGDRWTAEKVGDELVGTVIDIHTEEGRRGDVPVLRIDTGEFEREVWAPTDLQRKLADANVQVGDKLAMKLIELKPTGQPQPMKIFSIKHKRGEPANGEHQFVGGASVIAEEKLTTLGEDEEPF